MSIVAAVLRHRGLVMGMVVLCLLVGAALVLIPRREYLASSSFMPQTRKTPAGLSGLASQLGLPLASIEGRESPQFYVDLIEAQSILGSVVADTFTVRTDSGVVTTTLMQIYRSKGRTPGLKREAAIKQLRKNIAARADGKTAVVNLGVKAPYPDLALALNQRLLDLLNRYNMESRQSQASAERRFTERRLEEVRRELREAENRLQAFLQGNRDYRNSPELNFQYDRLQRDVNLKDQVYTTLAQSHEQSRIEEVRDTPVLTTVDPPERPVRPLPRGAIKFGILALLLGIVIGCTLAVGKDLIARSGQETKDELLELAALREAALDDLIHPWRPLRRLVRGMPHGFRRAS